MIQIKHISLELVFWIVALILLASSNPYQQHFTLCPLANLGFDWCPGCGIGRSIAAIFRGDLVASFKFHWFGVPALTIIAYRIYQLTKQLINKEKNLNYKEI
jgi:hypothetical protein